MQTSKFFIIIRNDNKYIKPYKSSFEKKIGDILKIESSTWKVVYLERTFASACMHINSFSADLLFNTYKF